MNTQSNQIVRLTLALVCSISGFTLPSLSTRAAATLRQSIPSSPLSTPDKTTLLGIKVWTSNGPESSISSVTLDPRNPNIVYAGGNGVFKSTNGGASWNPIYSSDPNTLVLALSVDPSNTAIIYAATSALGGECGGGVLKSTDGGASWAETSFRAAGFCNASRLAIASTNPTTLYAIVTDGLFNGICKTNDGGATWSVITPRALNYYSLAVDPSNSAVYVGLDGHCSGGFCSGGGAPPYRIFKSTDGGSSWSATQAALQHPIVAITISPSDPATIYAGTYGSGVYKSINGGATWNATNSGLPNTVVRALAIDPLNSNTIYAGTEYGGVFQSSDGGASWNAFNNGLANHHVNTLAIDLSGRFLHAGTAGGVFEINLASNNQIDDPQLFVHQHYLDFLSREPDAGGMFFWTNEITSCGGDSQCIDIKRINVSAAFFLSIEFQETGYLVYRLYKTAHGNLSGAPVPLQLTEFLQDAKQIGQGVVVNQAGWELLLENKTQAFVAEFVQRARFTSAYPVSMTPTEFVDQLFVNAEITPTTGERADAINEFGAANTTGDLAARASALRRVAENATLVQAEFNRAFVLMQYFGYLRRNPNDLPDADFSGYNFWLNKLDSFGGNFVNAEMVKAFISSDEYRRRFGP